LIAIGLARLGFLVGPKRHGPGDEFRTRGNVWTYALRERPAGTYPWVGLQLHDGTWVEGTLYSTSLPSGDERDIALKAPIWVTELDGIEVESPVDRLIVSEREIRKITVLHHPEPPTDERAARRRRRLAAHAHETLRRSARPRQPRA